MLPCLRCRLAPVALMIRPLAWELPYAVGAALKEKKKKKKVAFSEKVNVFSLSAPKAIGKHFLFLKRLFDSLMREKLRP